MWIDNSYLRNSGPAEGLKKLWRQRSIFIDAGDIEVTGPREGLKKLWRQRYFFLLELNRVLAISDLFIL